MMSRRQFIHKMLVSFKGLALMSAVSPAAFAAHSDGPGNGQLHYRPLNGRSLREIAARKEHHGSGRFHNPIGLPRNGRFWQVMSWKLFHRNEFEPYLEDQPITPVAVDWQPIRSHAGLSVTFLKHASVLIRDVDRYLLVDPVFDAIFWFVKDFSPLQFDPRQIPRPDQVLITHGHYDHLDKPSLELLDKDTHLISPLGYDDILDQLKFRNRTRLDWYDSFKDKQREITFLPCNHWTIRNPLAGPNRALWGRHRLLRWLQPAGPGIFNRPGDFQSGCLRTALVYGPQPHQPGRNRAGLPGIGRAQINDHSLGNVSLRGRAGALSSPGYPQSAGKGRIIGSTGGSAPWRHLFCCLKPVKPRRRWPALSKIRTGVLECWVCWKEICFYRVGRDPKNKIRLISVFNPQYSIIPILQRSQGSPPSIFKTHPSVGILYLRILPPRRRQ